jgi:hypothetical protein
VRRTLAGLLEAIYLRYREATDMVEQGVGLDLGPKELLQRALEEQAEATPARSATQDGLQQSALIKPPGRVGKGWGRKPVPPG